MNFKSKKKRIQANFPLPVFKLEFLNDATVDMVVKNRTAYCLQTHNFCMKALSKALCGLSTCLRHEQSLHTYGVKFLQ